MITRVLTKLLKPIIYKLVYQCIEEMREVTTEPTDPYRITKVLVSSNGAVYFRLEQLRKHGWYTVGDSILQPGVEKAWANTLNIQIPAEVTCINNN